MSILFHVNHPEAPWTPTDISGLTLWLKSDEGITKDGGDNVSQWDDQSGNSNHATQSNASYKPVWYDSQLNGYPGIRFDGSDNYLQVNGIASIMAGTDKPMSVFIVSKNTQSTGVNTTWMSFYSANVGDYSSYVAPIGHEGDPGYYRSRKRDSSGTAKSTTLAGSVTRNSFVHMSAIIDGTDAFLYEGGVLQNSGFTDIDLGVTYVDRAVIGALFFNYNGSDKLYYVKGDIVEMIVYDSELDTTNRQIVESYFESRYVL